MWASDFVFMGFAIVVTAVVIIVKLIQDEIRKGKKK
jgi:hypothetical protein